MDLSDVALKCTLRCELLSTETALHNLVLAMLFEDVPTQVADGELLVAQLTRHRLSVLRPNVLLHISHGFPANVTDFFLTSGSVWRCHFGENK